MILSLALTRDNGYLQAVADEVTGRVHQLTSKELTVLLYSCVRMRHSSNTRLLTEIVDRAVGSPQGWLSLKMLADMTWGFASIGCALYPLL